MDVGLVRQVNIDEEMQQAYLDYAMSVIVSRALPDVRDGLKPVHRRILYAMYDMGLRASSSYKKSARIVGEVLGKYHPHGDASVYDAMVRMAQDFSMRYELVDGQGNFGSIDGDAPAAMRYTEARMANFGLDLLTDIAKDTVDFDENFDGSLVEPAVLPSAVPNLLVNGSSGIAVGMSTNIPPHNLSEVCQALIYMLDNWEKLDDISVKDLMEFIKGPDFPTAGIVFTMDDKGEDGLVSAYATGRGKVIMRARAHIEELGRGKSRIIVTEIPFQTNKNNLIERIVSLAQNEKIEGLVDLRDESDRQGLRIVIEIGRHADPYAVLDDLFKYTPLQSTFGIISLALVDGEPRMLSLKQALREFIRHRLEVIRRRSEYDLARAEERAHILEGLLTAVQNIDEVIDTIRRSRTTETAHSNLMKKFSLSEAQATAILEMQLRRLAALERKKIEEELKEKRALIKDLKMLLSSEKLMRTEVKRETQSVLEDYGDERRTVIARSPAQAAAEGGDLLGGQDNTWVTITTSGKITRPHSDEPPEVRASMKEPPFRVVETNPADILYLITEQGNCATVLTSQIPKTNDITEGDPYWRVCDLTSEEPLAAVVSLPPSLEHGYLFFTSELGEVKRLKLEDLPGMRAKSFKLFDVEPGDRLRWAFWVNDGDSTLLVTRGGQAIHFFVDDVRPSGLTAGGVRGIKLGDDDRVVGAGVVGKYTHIWVTTDDGVGKRSNAEEYPTQGRGGQGVRTIKFLPGPHQSLAAALIGQLDNELVVLTTKGTAKRNRITNATSTKRDYKGEPNTVSLAKSELVEQAYIFEPRLEFEPPAQDEDE